MRLQDRRLFLSYWIECCFYIVKREGFSDLEQNNRTCNLGFGAPYPGALRSRLRGTMPIAIGGVRPPKGQGFGIGSVMKFKSKLHVERFRTKVALILVSAASAAAARFGATQAPGEGRASEERFCVLQKRSELITVWE